jgi:hypothetical protein
MALTQDRFTDYSAGPAAYGRGRVSRTGLTGARGMQSPYRSTSGMQRPSPITPGTLGGAVPSWTLSPGGMEMTGGGMAPAPRSPITPGRMGGGGVNYGMQMADTRPAAGRIPARPVTKPEPSYGHGLGPMTAEEANEWLNAGNYTGGGYATIKANLAAENARRWGDAAGTAPVGNQLNFGPITPGSKGKSWTWGAPPAGTAGAGTAGTGTAGTGTAGTGTAGGAKVPLTDPQTGLPFEDPQGNPVLGNPTGQPAIPTPQTPPATRPMVYSQRAMRPRYPSIRRPAYGSSPYLNY